MSIADTTQLAPENELPETVISSKSTLRMAQAVRDLVAYRELFRAFIARDIKVRYKQTALGVVWVVLQPLMTGGIFAVVFKKAGAMGDVSALQSLLFFMSGLVPWNTFQMAVVNASASMERSANLISKVYFPRVIVPTAYVAGSILDFCIALCVLLVIGLMGAMPVWWLVVGVPVLLPIQLAFAAGLGLFFAALNAQYHDIKYVVPFLLMIAMFVTVLVPLERWGVWSGWVLSFSPMTAVVEGFRALLAGRGLDPMLTLKGALVAAATLVAGLGFFRSRESKLVDIL